MTQNTDQMRAEFEKALGGPPSGIEWFQEMGTYCATRYGVSSEGYADKWIGWQAARASVKQLIPDGGVLVNKGALAMVINALRRDCDKGLVVRGEMISELLKPIGDV